MRCGIWCSAKNPKGAAPRLGRYFVRTDSGYQISKSIRDHCTFARQNLIKDPPFSHLDLISCRNVLIYLGPVLQKKIIPIFHFALKPGRYLILGKSEAISAFQDMFTITDKKYKFYTKKEMPGRVPLKFSLDAYAEREVRPLAKMHQHQSQYLMLARYLYP